jgi:sulfate adenylyltransferase subunit 2
MVNAAQKTGMHELMTPHLQALEAEAIEIMRETFIGCSKPVLMYSIGKDSGVLLHLAHKAFFPAQMPFPLLHIDTKWKFREMIAFREQIVAKYKAKLIVHTNPLGLEAGVNPITSGASIHTRVMKTEALRQALDSHQFDAAIGGARRDEERSRAKERVFSVRSEGHAWDPRAQRPELWSLYNQCLGPNQTLRVFPLSNWSELDVWRYIEVENIPVVPLYFAAKRPVVARNGTWIMVDDDRLKLDQSEVVAHKMVRFRTLGCYPLTGAIESQATTVAQIVEEMSQSRFSERQGRLIDQDEAASMERKKREGYF